MKKILGILALALTPSCLPAQVSVTVNAASPQWQISPYLMGIHQLYSGTPDSAYANGNVAAWAKRVGIYTSRFPGGSAVKTWNWPAPSGQLVWGPNSIPADPWNPAYSTANNADPSLWMSLDEYLAFVAASGIQPLFGVNSLSGQLYNMQTQGIARAVCMVNYVKQKGYGGAVWYIGNEEAQYYPGGIVGYAKVFALYAQAMKAADPNIRIFWNDNSASTGTTGSIAQFLANDSGTADGLETHGKFPYGGTPTPTPPSVSVAQWQAEVPLYDEANNNRVWRDAANDYRATAALVGRPNLLIANNEYGIGNNADFVGFNKYTLGLVEAEFLMELINGNWFSACMWDISGPGENGGLLDANDNYGFNPCNFGQNLLADSANGQYLTVTTNNPSVHGFAAIKQGLILLYLLNKTSSDQPLTIQLQGATMPMAFGRMMENSPSGFGQLGALAVQGQGTSFTVTLPTMTLGEFVFANPGPFLQPQQIWLQGGMVHIRWNSIPGGVFQMETSSDLVNWTAVGSTILPDNLWTETLVTPPTNAKTFYRFHLMNAPSP